MKLGTHDLNYFAGVVDNSEQSGAYTELGPILFHINVLGDF